MTNEEMQKQLETLIQQNNQLQQQLQTQAEFKKVGLFGATSNSIKAAAASLETIAAGINETASIGLFKVQVEGMESAREAGFQCQDLNDYQAIKMQSLAMARMSYK
jgi:flavin-binding protein dodecin